MSKLHCYEKKSLHKELIPTYASSFHISCYLWEFSLKKKLHNNHIQHFNRFWQIGISIVVLPTPFAHYWCITSWTITKFSLSMCTLWQALQLQSIVVTLLAFIEWVGHGCWLIWQKIWALVVVEFCHLNSPLWLSDMATKILYPLNKSHAGQL